MSPPQPEAPALAGSTRQAACFWPSASRFVASHPWGYQASTLRTSPMAPSLTQLLGEHDHREAGIGVRDEERGRGPGRGREQGPGLVEGRRQRLLAEDADPGRGGGVGRAEVGVVGGDDGDVVDPLALGQGGLGLHHRPPVAVTSGEEEVLGRLDRFLGLAPEGARGQFGRVIHEDRPAVRRPEEIRRTAAADHPHPQLALTHRVELPHRTRHPPTKAPLYSEAGAKCRGDRATRPTKREGKIHPADLVGRPDGPCPA